MSQPPSENPPSDDDEFAALMESMNTKLDKRTGSIRDTKELAKKHKDNPDLAIVRSCIADVQAGREDPRSSKLWIHGGEWGKVN